MRIGHRIVVRATEAVALVGLVAIAGVVFLGVLDRYLLGVGYFWTEELARFLLIWCSFLGASIAVERKGHLAVSFFSERFFSGRRLSALRAFVALCSILASLVLVVEGYALTLSGMDEISPALRIPMSWVFVAVPINGMLMLYFMLVRAAAEMFAVASRRGP